MNFCGNPEERRQVAMEFAVRLLCAQPWEGAAADVGDRLRDPIQLAGRIDDWLKAATDA